MLFYQPIQTVKIIQNGSNVIIFKSVSYYFNYTIKGLWYFKKRHYMINMYFKRNLLTILTFNASMNHCAKIIEIIEFQTL